jgi:aminoglycoside 6'-N-acetyltransferase I
LGSGAAHLVVLTSEGVEGICDRQEERLQAAGAMTLYLGSDDGPVPGTSAGGVDRFPDVLSHAARLRVVDHPAGFYLRQGFEIIGLIPDANGPGKPDVLMAKRIGPASYGASSRTQ